MTREGWAALGSWVDLRVVSFSASVKTALLEFLQIAFSKDLPQGSLHKGLTKPCSNTTGVRGRSRYPVMAMLLTCIPALRSSGLLWPSLSCKFPWKYFISCLVLI